MLLFRTLFLPLCYPPLLPFVNLSLEGFRLERVGTGIRRMTFPLSCRSRPGFIHWVVLDFLLHLCLILFPIFLLRPSFSRQTISSWSLLFKPSLPIQILGSLKAQLLYCLAKTSPGLEASCWFILEDNGLLN